LNARIGAMNFVFTLNAALGPKTTRR